MSATVRRDGRGDWSGDATTDIFDQVVGWVSIDVHAVGPSPSAVIRELAYQTTRARADIAGQPVAKQQPVAGPQP